MVNGCHTAAAALWTVPECDNDSIIVCFFVDSFQRISIFRIKWLQRGETRDSIGHEVDVNEREQMRNVQRNLCQAKEREERWVRSSINHKILVRFYSHIHEVNHETLWLPLWSSPNSTETWFQVENFRQPREIHASVIKILRSTN